MLVDLVHGRVGGCDVVLSGLAAVLLGCCLLFNEGGQEGGGLGKRALLDVITGRVGLSDMFAKLEALRQSDLLAVRLACSCV